MSNDSIISESFNFCNKYAPEFMNKQVPYWAKKQILQTPLLSDNSKIHLVKTFSPEDGENLQKWCDSVTKIRNISNNRFLNF